jgi:hypothetical protein
MNGFRAQTTVATLEWIISRIQLENAYENRGKYCRNES